MLPYNFVLDSKRSALLDRIEYRKTQLAGHRAKCAMRADENSLA